MTLHLLGCDLHLFDIRTRMPFKYGIATMTESPYAFVRVRLHADNRTSPGIAADCLPPKWFTKDPHKPLDTEVQEMLLVIEQALMRAADLRGANPFDLWLQLYMAQDAWGRDQGLPPLLVHFGTSLVERAMIDAFCRVRNRAFAELLLDEELGLRLGDIHPVLTGRRPRNFLASEPLKTIIARHTIGLADPLTDGEIARGEELNDGLPQSLEACIRAYGLRHFKVKISGQLDRDRERLEAISAILHRSAPIDFAFSLDGNEQFHDLAAFRSYWSDLLQSAELARFFEHLLFVEQPLHRAVALQRKIADFTTQWPNRPPVIIDESDGEWDSLPQALDLGYAGTSHKNCKGVFKGIANACLLRHLDKSAGAGAYRMSGEDLANIGPVALLQDLAVDAVLGISSVERNGHHYFAGLSMFPTEVQQQTLAAHGDLYRTSPAGWPTLAIHEGKISLRSVVSAPFGVMPLLNVDQFLTVAEWRRQHCKEST
jgi:hypothetical protein